MGPLIFVCLLVGAALALVGVLAMLGAGLLEDGVVESAGGPERRQFNRVPCRFRTTGPGAGAATYGGDLSLGGACVRLPAATLAHRLQLLAVDTHGLTPAAVVEGEVLSMQREGKEFVHHLAFDANAPKITVGALVAAATWGE